MKDYLDIIDELHLNVSHKDILKSVVDKKELTYLNELLGYWSIRYWKLFKKIDYVFKNDNLFIAGLESILNLKRYCKVENPIVISYMDWIFDNANDFKKWIDDFSFFSFFPRKSKNYYFFDRFEREPKRLNVIKTFEKSESWMKSLSIKNNKILELL